MTKFERHICLNLDLVVLGCMPEDRFRIICDAPAADVETLVLLDDHGPKWTRMTDMNYTPSQRRERVYRIRPGAAADDDAITCPVFINHSGFYVVTVPLRASASAEISLGSAVGHSRFRGLRIRRGDGTEFAAPSWDPEAGVPAAVLWQTD